MESTTKSLKLDLFDRSLPVIGSEVGVAQRRGVRFVSGELLDLEQGHSRGDQARAVGMTQIVVAKRRPQHSFSYSLLEP